MKENFIMTPANQQAFERSMDMLDNSINELRRVAHNMMPEALVKFGLDTALKDLCHEITKSGVLNISYQSFAMNSFQADQTISVTIYRITQELITNAVKHAAATHVLVQLAFNNNKLTITVEDNGKGFDPAGLTSSRGMGWSNVSSRVEFLKGVMDVQSAPGKGTTINIEIAL